MSAALLRLDGICKHFGSVQALDHVDLELAVGEVHALLGENGAGKSTLIKVLTGAYPRDSGRMTLDGADIHPGSPAAAQQLGISTVYQEVNLLPNLSVAHNLFLGHEPRRLGCIDWRSLHADACTVLQRFGLTIDVTQTLASFSLAVQQLIAIARGVELSARVLILDEPTASLDADEVAVLFGVIEELKSAGIGIIFVTHFLDQVYAISDRITVLRNGRRVGTFEARTLPRSELVAHMLGKELQAIESGSDASSAAGERSIRVRAENLAADNGLRGASLSAAEGEAVGLAGLLGSGRTEFCETLFGLAAPVGGAFEIGGRAVSFESPGQAMRAGLALCPEDRRAAGIVGELSVRENVTLALQVRRGWWQRVPRAEQERLARKAIDDFAIACAGPDAPAGTLSGGNQQKVILARWLCTEPAILILDEPTRGIDIGAHAEIIRLIREFRDRGLAVIIASSELEELVAFSDRVVVMREGRSVGELVGAAITEPAIVAAVAHSA